MRPNLTNVNKALDRMEEIARKCSIPYEAQSLRTPKQRFIEVLDTFKTDNKTDIERKLKNARSDAGDFGEHIARYAEQYNIDEELVRAVIHVESGGKPDAVSNKGAMGLMQLMPRTASMLGVEDPFDPEQNIEGGVKYLSQLTDKYAGDVERALAAYNAGPSRVDKSSTPPFPETARYVQKVMALYHRYREES